MSGRLRLETFADGPVPAADPSLEALREDIRGTAYEQGYSAGWDDAIAARDTDEAQLRKSVLSNLSDLSFSYHEAHAHVLSAIRPLLFDMVRKVLPAIARDTLGQMVVDLILPIARDLAGAPITITVSPVGRAVVETALADNVALPMTVVEDAELSPGQAYLRLGETETHLDLDGVVAAISAAVEAFFATEPTEEKLSA